MRPGALNRVTLCILFAPACRDAHRFLLLDFNER